MYAKFCELKQWHCASQGSTGVVDPVRILTQQTSQCCIQRGQAHRKLLGSFKKVLGRNGKKLLQILEGIVAEEMGVVIHHFFHFILGVSLKLFHFDRIEHGVLVLHQLVLQPQSVSEFVDEEIET